MRDGHKMVRDPILEERLCKATEANNFMWTEIFDLHLQISAAWRTSPGSRKNFFQSTIGQTLFYLLFEMVEATHIITSL